MIAIASLLFALIIALVLGSNLRRLSVVRLKLEALLPVGFAAQLVGPSVFAHALHTSVLVWMAGAVLVLVVALANRSLLGFWFVSLGVLLNMLVILLNAGMPVSAEAMHYLGVTDVQAVMNDSPAMYTLLDDNTVAPVLADVLPVPAPPPARSIASIGDVFLMIGVVVVLLEIVNHRGVDDS